MMMKRPGFNFSVQTAKARKSSQLFEAPVFGDDGKEINTSSGSSQDSGRDISDVNVPVKLGASGEVVGDSTRITTE